MNKRQKRGLLILMVGVLLLFAGLGIHLAQQQEDAAAGRTATLLLQQLDDETVIKLETNDDPFLPKKTYMGYSLIGEIDIPSVGIRLPVLDDWNQEMLKAAPCRYQGSISDNNMIVMGHNYKHHFDPLHKIEIGAQVQFRNAVGAVLTYRVAKIEYLHRTQGENLPSADYPLTLFTCTASGLDRIVVRCEAVETTIS